MKKRTLLVLLAFVMLLILGLFFRDFIAASIFDAFAISQTTTLNVTVDAFRPSLIVDSPTETNYSTVDVDINYSVSDSGSGVDTVWYNLDGGRNTTLTGNMTIVVSKNRDYNLYIYANDSAGLVNDTEFVFFTCNATMEVNFSRFDVPDTTNFSDLNNFELEDIENLILEISTYGKVRFDENINISNDTCLDTYADISNNNIFIDSDVLPNFNKAATLWIYGLTWDDPQVLKDGSVCPESICTEVDYSGGTLEFTVTGFTNYSTRETPTAAPPTGRVAGEGTGAGGTKVLIKSFNVDTYLLKLQLKRGEVLKKTIRVKNDGEVPLTLTIDAQELAKFVFLPEQSFTLRPGETEDVTLEFITTSIPQVYTGKIVLKSEDIQKIVAVIIEVESEKVLYDATLDIPARYTKLTTERYLPLTVTIFNIAGPETADVELEYLIVNKDAEVIVKENETVSVNQQASFTKTLRLPEEMPYGEYVAVIIVKYGESVGTSSRVFEVVRPAEELSLLRQGIIKNVLVIGIAMVLILSFVMFSSSYIHHKRLRNIEQMQAKRLPKIYEEYKTKAMIQENKEKEREREKAKDLLGKEQKLLDDALKLKYISQDSYQKAKKRIDDVVKRIK